MNEENNERNRLEFLLNKSPDGKQKKGLEGEIVHSFSYNPRTTQAVQLFLDHGAKRGERFEATLIIELSDPTLGFHTDKLLIKDCFNNVIFAAEAGFLGLKRKNDKKLILELIESLKKEKGFEPPK